MRYLLRFACALTAWFVGWVVYMIAMMLTVYDGVLSLIFQPIMAALWSTVFVVAALFAGIVFRLRALGDIWRSSRIWAVAIICASLFTMCVGPYFGWTETVKAEGGTLVTILHPDLALICYFGLLFAIANWPIRRSKNVGSSN